MCSPHHPTACKTFRHPPRPPWGEGTVRAGASVGSRHCCCGGQAIGVEVEAGAGNGVAVGLGATLVVPSIRVSTTSRSVHAELVSPLICSMP